MDARPPQPSPPHEAAMRDVPAPDRVSRFLPRSVAARVALHLIVLAMGLIVALPSPARAAWFRRRAPATAPSGKLALEKERVPKPPPGPSPRTKPDTSAPSNDDTDDDEDTGNCASDCLFGGLFGSSHHEPATVAEPV